jgi:hypothetical protein
MRNYEEKEVTINKKFCARRVCDLCGKETPGLEWERGYYEVAETQVNIRTGNGYPDGGSGVESTVDICPNCFREKLIPWVESHGVSKIEEKEWDY